jgi:hypothetical protein
MDFLRDFQMKMMNKNTHEKTPVMTQHADKLLHGTQQNPREIGDKEHGRANMP